METDNRSDEGLSRNAVLSKRSKPCQDLVAIGDKEY